MNYFKELQDLLKIEQEEDKNSFIKMNATASVSERRTNGITWYPLAIKGVEPGKGDYVTVELERTTHQDIIHQFRSGMPAALFSNHNAKEDRVEGIVSHVYGNKLKLALRTEELPEWSRNGKLGIDLLFDENSYDEMFIALKAAGDLSDNDKEGHLVQTLIGNKHPTFNNAVTTPASSKLNASQNNAVQKIIASNELAIVHGPPGTGKTTTLVAAIKAILQKEEKQILVVAPSNAAVDLLSEKLADEGLKVVRAGNPARVTEKLLSLTLDGKTAEDTRMKEVKRLKKQAQSFRDMAHKYKRNFGKAEREQRKALFDEAHKVMKEAEKTEQYITEALLNEAQVITATLVGSNHYSIKNRKYHTVIIDEAGQAIEPACWIPVLKAQRLIMAGDHNQLPPTIKSQEAAKKGLEHTLMAKCVELFPDAVVLLEEQYRMHEQIMGYSSAVFYNNALKAHISVAQHLLFPEDLPLTFIDTAGSGFEEKQEGSSISNPEEAAFLIKHFTQFITGLETHYNQDNFPTIGIISPYKQQVLLLQELMREHELMLKYRHKISVNTIDSFQGQERDIVYISMTRSNTDNNVGFLTDTRRMNVAMTRARKKLIVIGDSSTLASIPFYEGFIAYAEAHNAWQSCWEFSDL
ncbi:AAA family ATPase [Taibaiella lutea]|uniref:AAA family ATPase n=1 Tax=Taibaiella lutea TaxID=2608001 RepID=A0A5M6CC63_9BACT|nr:AAA domain-containing protein [Taibaiella lutea]KAA5532726.1 AAA family ATPase [Taibaiella lutea]